ncbi:MAG: insulinase family protein [Bacteroidales bacterium]|jgi:zinc protease|nr:insulinase family protein [Bacteroidales bacterium]
MLSSCFKSIWIFCLFFVLSAVHAQDFDLQTPLPVDTAVKTGRLDNGLVYYLRNNGKPEKRIELRLAVKAGSICETDQQKGLAHFVEHMCFNGTKNFKENELVNVLEEMGVKFGADLNAYTSFDETVYKLQVPSDRADLIEKAFQVLEDWAHQVTFADKDIDDERGVIVEEWRLGLGAEDRMLKKYLPALLKDSRYAERLPIGDMDIIKKAPYSEFRKFYKDWYRPDLMAVAVVGDIPLKEMESKVKQHFTALTNPADAPQRIEYDIPGNKDPLITIVTDKEATANIVQLLVKHPRIIEKTVGDYRDMLIQQLYNGMINKRFNEIAQEPDAPFMYAGSDYSSFLGPIDAYAVYAVAKENEIEKSLEVLLLENERVEKFGFTQTELDREKQDVLTAYAQSANEAGKINSDRLVDEYVRNFVNQEPIPGILTENAYAQHFIPDITLEEVNRLATKWFTDENMCLIVMAPEKDGISIPAENDLLQILKDSKQVNLTEYVDKVVDEPLLEKKPEGTRVFRRKVDTDFGYTELIFMNGVHVLLKSTDFKNDQVLFSGFSPGGTSLYLNEDYMSAIMATSIVTMSGLGDFDQIALGKKLTGNTAKLSPYVGEIYEGVSGSTAPKDLETLLQLNYMYFTAVRRDEKAFNTLISQFKNQVVNMRANPLYAYMDTLYRVVTSNNPRTVTIPTEEQIDRIRLDNALYIFNDRFADASDFKFVMVGNFNVDEVTPLLETYLGGLPSKRRVETWRDVTPVFPAGITRFDFARNSEDQSRVNIFMKGPFKWNLKERVYFSMFTDILNIKLRESMREEQGGVYGVNASNNVSQYPKPRYSLDFVWGCSPENAEKLTATVFDEVRKIKADGPTDVDLDKVKETLIRERETAMKENSYWQAALLNTYRQGDKLTTFEDYKKLINSVKAKDIRRIARQYFNEANYAVGKLMPAKN